MRGARRHPRGEPLGTLAIVRNHDVVARASEWRDSLTSHAPSDPCECHHSERPTRPAARHPSSRPQRPGMDPIPLMPTNQGHRIGHRLDDAGLEERPHPGEPFHLALVLKALHVLHEFRRAGLCKLCSVINRKALPKTRRRTASGPANASVVKRHSNAELLETRRAGGQIPPPMTPTW